MEYSHIVITTSVRSPKEAVLVLKTDEYWIASCKGTLNKQFVFQNKL